MDKHKLNGIYKTIMIIILTALVASLFTSVIVYRYVSNSLDGEYFVIKNSEEQSNVAAIIDEYVSILEKKYLGELDETTLIDGAGTGLIQSLNDPYSEYVSKEEMDSYATTILGNYYGIGIYMVGNVENGLIEVLSPIKGSPAEEVGILPGDFIISVEGVKYTSNQMTEASDAIKGKEGSYVTIEILRGEETLSFEVERREVKLNHVEGKKLENNIGYIQFSTFDSEFATEFTNVFNELKTEGIQSLIIDLRNNGGGLVSEALGILECILDKGSTMLITVDKNNNEEIEKSKSEPIINMPIVVLVNENSASATEILAGALQDYGKAKIVGTKTYGKGVIQQLITLSSGNGLKLTIQEYYTPNKNKINEIGITPDEIVELPDTVTNILSVSEDEDTQLQKAIELLK